MYILSLKITGLNFQDCHILPTVPDKGFSHCWPNWGPCQMWFIEGLNQEYDESISLRRGRRKLVAILHFVCIAWYQNTVTVLCYLEVLSMLYINGGRKSWWLKQCTIWDLMAIINPCWAYITTVMQRFLWLKSLLLYNEQH